MRLANGFTDVPAGKLAAVVTHLEMFERPAARESAAGEWSLHAEKTPDPRWYRDLFTRVGAPYLWMSRLRMSDDELRATIHDTRVEIFALEHNGRDEGILELDFRTANECELVFFGVTDALVGTGAARAMMNFALERAWGHPIRRFWVHTCTLDHPKAVPFYLRSGFVPFRRQLEILDDPRLLGILPRDAAPAVPLLE